MQTLENSIPPIRRAREYYLYTVDGTRIIDLYRFGGAALLGYRPAGLVLAQKHRLAEGLAAPLPSVFPARLALLLAQRFPGHPHVRIFRDRERAIAALSAAGYPAPADPAFAVPESAGATVSLWRPFLQTKPTAGVLLPVLPDPSGFSPQAVCLAVDPGTALRSDAVSAVALSGAIRACGLLAAALAERDTLLQSPPTRGRARPPQRPQRIVPERELQRHTGTVWQARGPYLTTALDAEAYHLLFARYLAAGVLVSPSPQEPTILPQTMTPGEFTLFIKSGTIARGARL